MGRDEKHEGNQFPASSGQHFFATNPDVPIDRDLRHRDRLTRILLSAKSDPGRSGLSTRAKTLRCRGEKVFCLTANPDVHRD